MVLFGKLVHDIGASTYGRRYALDIIYSLIYSRWMTAMFGLVKRYLYFQPKFGIFNGDENLLPGNGLWRS